MAISFDDVPMEGEQGKRKPASGMTFDDVPEISTTEDVLRSGAAGVRRNIEGVGGVVGDVSGLARLGISKLAKLAGVDPEIAAAIKDYNIPILPDISSETIHDATSKVIGESYQPQTTAGKYAGTMAEFAPLLPTGGLAGIARKTATGLTAGAASEAAGQATEGTALEPWARGVAGIAGGAAVGAGTKGTGAARTMDDRMREADVEDAALRQGVKLTKGQRTGDVSQQMDEQQLLRGARGGWGQRLMDLREQDNRAALKDRAQEFRDTTAPTRGGEPVLSADLLQQQVRDRASTLKQTGGQAIEKAMNEGILFDADRLRGLPAELNTKFEGNVPFVPDVVLSPNTPITNEAMKRIEKFVSQAEDPNLKEFSAAGAEKLRQQLSKLIAETGEDKRALNKLKTYYDDWMADSIDNATVAPTSGRSPRDVLADLKAGRGTYKEGADITDPLGKPPGGKQVAKIATEGTFPESTARLFTPTDRGDLSEQAMTAIDRLVRTGSRGGELDQIRDIILEKLTTGDPGKVATRVDNFIRNNPSTAKTLFKEMELERLKDWAETNRRTVPDPKAMNPSGTNFPLIKEMLKGGAIRKTLGGIPVVRNITEPIAEAATELKGRSAAKRALAPVDRSTPGEAAAKGAVRGGGRGVLPAVRQQYTIDDPGGETDGQKAAAAPDQTMNGRPLPDTHVRVVLEDGRTQIVSKQSLIGNSE